MKKLFIIVLYKIDIFECATLNSFKICNLFKNDDNFFYIWDNSPESLSASEISYVKNLGKNVVYESHPENTSLAIVYNTIISKYNNCDYYAIFDQDTELKDYNYEQLIDSALTDNPQIDLFIPVVYTKAGLLYSPGKFIFPGKAIKLRSVQVGVINAKNLTGIASGLIISHNYIESENFRFNEKLKLYGVDTDFFINYSKRREKLFILPINISHSLSFEDSSISDEEQWCRFMERVDCLFLIYDKFYELFCCRILKFYYKLRYHHKRGSSK